MIGKKKLTEKQKLVLKELTNYKCEQCKEKFKPKELEIHRITRGNKNGTYKPSNIKILCKECHQLFHGNEPNMRSK